MSIQGLSPVVETIVDEKVQIGEMFTAHDVTLEVRVRGHRCGHGDVRDAVHDYYNRGGMGVGYARTNIPVAGRLTPYLYHRTVDDPSTYQNVRAGQISQSTPNLSATPNVPDNQVVKIPANLLTNVNQVMNSQNHTPNIARSHNKPGMTLARVVDSRQTLSIPSNIVRDVGFHTGQKVFAVAGVNCVNIVNSQPIPSTSVFCKYTVDCHDQIRLTQSFLARAGIGGVKYDISDSYDVAVGNKVVVKLNE